MSVASGQFPTQSAFAVEQGTTEWGRYIGFNFSPLFRITNQGNNVGVDLNPSAIGNTGAFGDGSDGPALFDGATVVAGATLGGSTYTLDRDVLYTDMVVSAGITVRTFNFRLLVNGTLTNNGVIHNDGNAAALDVAGAALTAQTLGAAAAGGNGGTNAAGTAGNATAFSLDNGTGIGGDGGAGGVNAGGVAGAFVGLIAVLGTARSLPGALNGMASSPSVWTSVQGGSGGGGGGSNDATTLGGGGGGGGGVMVLIAYALVNNGVIRCAGGAGASASGAGGDAGTGGGGGGGTLFCITRSRSGAGTYTAPGGAPGATVVAAGVLGLAGAAGNVLQLAA